MTYASVGWRFPLDGFTRSDHRERSKRFHAESPSACLSMSPRAAALSRRSRQLELARLIEGRAAEAAYPSAPWQTPGVGYRGKTGVSANPRKGRGCDAQSRYPSDRANAWK